MSLIAMTLSFYFDEMMPRSAAKQLVDRNIDVVMAIDVDMAEKPDDDHLAFAIEHERVLVTFDRPFAGRTSKLREHPGLVCLSGSQKDIGSIVKKLVDLTTDETMASVKGRVFWL